MELQGSGMPRLCRTRPSTICFLLLQVPAQKQPDEVPVHQKYHTVLVAQHLHVQRGIRRDGAYI